MSKMKTYDASYDRLEAIRLAHTLNTRSRHSDTYPLPKLSEIPNETHEESSEARVQEVESPGTLPQVPEIGFNSDGQFREDIWKELLQWAMVVSNGFWSFVSDEKGFLIAEVGEEKNFNKEEMISNIISGLHNLSRLGEPGQTNLLQFQQGSYWVSVVLCYFGESDMVLVGFLSEHEPSSQTSIHIRESFNEKLKDF